MPWRAAVAEILGCVDVSRNAPQQIIGISNRDSRNFTPAASFQPELQHQGLMQLDGWSDLMQYAVSTAPGDAFPVSSLSTGGNGCRKRKAESPQAPVVKNVGAVMNNEKRAKGALHHPKQEVQSNPTPSNSNSGKETSADNSKQASEVVQKPDYVHVRARRGQATDSHSLAERARREKISERMKYLQDLVPGCNKITGKAGMLDEIINYVQSLQRQVEFLSMKLATVNPVLDFGSHEFPIIVSENVTPYPGGTTGMMAMPPGLMSTSIVSPTSTANCGPGLALNLQDLAVNMANGTASLPDFSMDARFNVAGSSSLPWDAVLQSVLTGDLCHANATHNQVPKAYQGAA